MRRLFVIFSTVFLTVSVFAQSPQKMSYQAIIRNNSDELVVSKVIGMKISILKGSESGTIAYSETQTPTTNANGLVTIEIGTGTTSDDFSTIDWTNGPYFIKTETAVAAPLNTYTITGISQLLSVPYALYAERAGRHYIGELFGGGVVFYVDHTGSHGLICSVVDLSTGMAWSNITAVMIGTAAQSFWNGLSNSNAIIAQTGHTISAAKLCLDYTNADYGTGIFSDWYLPSSGELTLLFNDHFQVQKTLETDGNASTLIISKNGYWSSTEGDANNAILFGIGYQETNSKHYTDYWVRAVRSF